MLLHRALAVLSILIYVSVNGAELVTGFIPACPLKCLRDAVNASSVCSQADLECKCNNVEIYDQTTACVLRNCSLSDGVLLSKVQSDVCQRPQESRQDTIRIWLIIPAVIVMVTSALRYISCWKVRGGLFLEDYLIIAAILIYWILISLIFDIVNLGFGTHIYQLNPQLVGKILKIFFIAENLYAVEVIVIKISLCCFFLRIFPQKIFRKCCYAMIIFMAILAAVWVLLLVFQCKPITSNWNINIEHPRCYNIQVYSYVGAAAAMSQDACILALPIPLVLQLRISVKKKIGVIIMFSLGIFVTITSAVRTKAIKYFGTSGDPSWDNIDITIWTSLEICVGLVCCNMPAIAGLISHLRRRYIYWSRSETRIPSEPKYSGNSYKYSISSRPWSRSTISRNSTDRAKRIQAINTNIYSDLDLERGLTAKRREIESRRSVKSEGGKDTSSWLQLNSDNSQKKLPILPPASLLSPFKNEKYDFEDIGSYRARELTRRKTVTGEGPMSRSLGSGIIVKKDFSVEEDIIDNSDERNESNDVDFKTEPKERFEGNSFEDEYRIQMELKRDRQQKNEREAPVSPLSPLSPYTPGTSEHPYQRDENLDLLVYKTFFNI